MEIKIEEVVVMRTWRMEVGGPRKIGRSKLRRSDVTQKDVMEKGVQREDAQDRRT